MLLKMSWSLSARSSLWRKAPMLRWAEKSPGIPLQFRLQPVQNKDEVLPPAVSPLQITFETTGFNNFLFKYNRVINPAHRKDSGMPIWAGINV
jgi:hypothetical protein